jgi:nicotinate-nucleotide pyrophosphorylase (carboxylating)
MGLETDAHRVAALALDEDGPFDITSELTVAEGDRGEAGIEARSPGVLACSAYVDAVIRACDLPEVRWLVKDGERFDGGHSLGILTGPLRGILRAERPLLNLLQRACGIASVARAYVDALRGTKCRVLHTRKTTPGLRAFEIRAVLAGGAERHRADLSRTVMVKNNHWRGMQSGGITLSDARLRAVERGVTAFQVEVESPAQLEAACRAGATRVLVDNQSPATVRDWAARARSLAPSIEVEATGGIDLENVRAYGEAGADFVSVGALTHSVRSLDIALAVGKSR